MDKNKKNVAFFDLDGTLCDSSGEVLPSSVKAIRQFREQGNIAFICTGRSKPEILDSIVDIGFDGVVGAGGGYIVVGDKIIHHKRLPKDAVQDIVKYFDENDVGYYLECNDGLFKSENCERKIREELKQHAAEIGETPENLNHKMTWFYELLEKYDGLEVDYNNVNKISFINNTVPFDDIVNRYGESLQIYHSTVPLFGKWSGEIGIKGISKKEAIEFVLNYLGVDKEQSIAFGDGNNDIAMFEVVGYGIAMANATPDLKKIANEITADSDSDGIAISLEKWLV
ncbi:HAD family hydrolase [Vagococcus vulneris]|uniref:HAD family hydrolase n=1 Tax=Vagococcus vulneris TaxID=1977869 RepID=A0A430A0J0_9ENTE|nr:HAD family hydrolase [Vagococcus vulneris]RST99842.1 HAD family hydrolase [Vagococcus vulneris]